jgi:hypothetical protein
MGNVPTLVIASDSLMTPVTTLFLNQDVRPLRGPTIVSSLIRVTNHATNPIEILNTNIATSIENYRKRMPFQAMPPIATIRTMISSVQQMVTTVLSRDMLPLFVFTIT